MAFFHIFCFACSLRLGAIVIATITLITSATFAVCFFVLSVESRDTEKNFQAYFSQSTFLETVSENLHLLENLRYYTIGLTVYYTLMTISCAILIVGAYQCKPNLIYQFLFFYMVYIILFCLFVLFSYLSVIKPDDPLGAIMYFASVILIIIFVGYTWMCIYSLGQVIKEIQKRLTRKIFISKFPAKHPLKQVTH